MRPFSCDSKRISRFALAAALIACASATGARADEAQARELFQAMSDYLAAQTAISFDFDSTLDVVTTDDQKLGIASSGSAALERPDKLHATRTDGLRRSRLPSTARL